MSGIETSALLAYAAAGASAASAYQSSVTQKTTADYNAKVAENQAQAARTQGAANEEAQRRQASVAIGRMATVAADGSGLSGTSLDMIGQSATNAELDALNIRYGAKIGAANSMDQAGLLRAQGRDAETAGYLSMASSALSAYGSYAKGQPKRSSGSGLTGG
jgi:hypothetical protein